MPGGERASQRAPTAPARGSRRGCVGVRATREWRSWRGSRPQTRLVYVADRESDMLELMVRARDLGTPTDGLLRSPHHRTWPEGGRLWAKVLASPPLGEVRFTVPGGRGRTAREVRQALVVQRVAVADGRGGAFDVTCLIAREIGAPSGVKLIAWRRLTNRPAATLAAVAELIDGYRARWEVELRFLVLKAGCCIAARQLSTMARPWRYSWWWLGASRA